MERVHTSSSTKFKIFLLSRIRDGFDLMTGGGLKFEPKVLVLLGHAHAAMSSYFSRIHRLNV